MATNPSHDILYTEHDVSHPYLHSFFLSLHPRHPHFLSVFDGFNYSVQTGDTELIMQGKSNKLTQKTRGGGGRAVDEYSNDRGIFRTPICMSLV